MIDRAESAANDNPIINSPYAAPDRHWEISANGSFTQKIREGRRSSVYYVPVAPKSRRGGQTELDLTHDDYRELPFEPNALVNGIRERVDAWRRDGYEGDLRPETRRLLEHWRGDSILPPPFFCQLEAVETVIWLTEVAPRTVVGRQWRETLKLRNEEANPGLLRIAAKMATGSGKTTVMAMLIAWQAVNAARKRRNYSKAFLVICPGITIRDRLKVLDPQDSENYYETRKMVPDDMLPAIRQARVVIHNYHVFKARETAKIPKYAREVIQGRDLEPVITKETEGQLVERVCKDLGGARDIVVLNDEAHHCYQEKPGKSEEAKAGDEGDDIKRNKEAARLWINGIDAVARRRGLRAVYDLSATPFFLRGSGYREGTLFPWVVSDFSLIDAIEAGIVKIPRVPVSDNDAGHPMPVWRALWSEISNDMPKKGAKNAGTLDPGALPGKLLGAIHGLYEHYEKVDSNWTGFATPPVFIVVCQNTAHSKLIFDYIAGYQQTVKTPDGEEREVWVKGMLPLFSNVDADGRPLARPNTLLIDSNELESGETLSADFKRIAAPEIDAFKQDLAARFGQGAIAKVTDEDLLREAMNTVGRAGRLGADIRCVVSVSMLTEGWDTNTVTHILGVRAFGTELLCEQVVGRGLRRVSYDATEDTDGRGYFEPEYANIFGIPFSFASEDKRPQTTNPPKHTVQVRALRERVADRPELEITFPRVQGYRIKLPPEPARWEWTADSRFRVDQSLTPTRATIEDLLGQGETITLENWMDQRPSTAAFHIAGHALRARFRDEEDNLKPWLFPRLLKAAREWLDNQVTLAPGMGPGIFLWRPVADEAADRLYNAFIRGEADDSEAILLPIIDPMNPTGSSAHVDFRTSKPLWETSAAKCHVSHVVGDSRWETALPEALEHLPEVIAYVKNHAMHFEVPYTLPGGVEHRYLPDFIARIDDGRGDLLNLIIETKGQRRPEDAWKAEAITTKWVPAVNNDGRFGRWAFVEIRDIYNAKDDIRAAVAAAGGER